MVEAGDIYHPLRWTAPGAYRFLADLPRLQAAGIIVRTPGVWKADKPPRLVIRASLGARPPSLLDRRQDMILKYIFNKSIIKNRLKRKDGDCAL